MNLLTKLTALVAGIAVLGSASLATYAKPKPKMGGTSSHSKMKTKVVHVKAHTRVLKSGKVVHVKASVRHIKVKPKMGGKPKPKM